MMATSPCRLPLLLGQLSEKLTDESDVMMFDEDDFLSHTMTINLNDTIVKERIGVNRVASETAFQVLHPGIQLRDERVTPVREDPLDFHTVPIYEGYAMHHAILRLAGRDTADFLVKKLTEQMYSFAAAAERDIARGVKEKPCYTSADYDTVLKSTVEEKIYELPNGNFTVGAKRFHCVKVFFQPIFTSKEANGVHDTSFLKV